MNVFVKVYQKIQTKMASAVNNAYSKKVRKQLKNDQFTILCSNCIGGIIYHRLGKEFLSPTINMWMNQREFLVFLENLKECLEADVEFVKSERYTHPIGVIHCGGGDVTLYFNHDKTEEEAKENWYRRRERVNFDNLYIIMYDRDGVTKEDLKRLEAIPCNNKVVLSDKRYEDLPYVCTLKASSAPFGPQYLDKDWSERRSFEKQFDYIGFLNTL